MTCLKRTNGLFTIGKRLIERLEMTYLALVNDLFMELKWLVYHLEMTCLATLKDLLTSHQGYFRLGLERWQVPRIYRWPSQREVLSICFCWRLIRASFQVSERKQEVQLALQAIPWWLQGMDKRAAELRLCLQQEVRFKSSKHHREEQPAEVWPDAHEGDESARKIIRYRNQSSSARRTKHSENECFKACGEWKVFLPTALFRTFAPAIERKLFCT